MFQSRRMKRTMSRKKAAIAQTLVDYSEDSSVHGVGYVFKKSLPLSDRILWLLSVVLFLVLACYFLFTAYKQWQENLTITSLENTAKDVNQLEFPMVTLCASGLNFKAVRKVLERNFEGWKSVESEGQEEKAETKSKLKETFGTDDLNLIMDFVQSMFYIDVPKGIEVLSLMSYLTGS